MGRALGVIIVIGMLLALPLSAGAQSTGAFSVTCQNGASFDNGVEIIVVQMRSGFTYTATAVGIDGFDPVLAVLDSSGNGLCSDDESGAARYQANLPSTGRVPASNLSAQVRFSQNSVSQFDDVSLVVGGFGNQTGEFIVIIEGMGVTATDGAGDPFAVNITQEMIASGVPLTAYMLTRGTSGVDPLFYVRDAATLEPIADNRGNFLYWCDDAGNPSLCTGDSVRLDNYSVTIATGTLPGWQYDAMLSLALEDTLLSADRGENYLTFVATSYQQRSQGQYLLVFHIGTADAISKGARG